MCFIAALHSDLERLSGSKPPPLAHRGKLPSFVIGTKEHRAAWVIFRYAKSYMLFRRLTRLFVHDRSEHYTRFGGWQRSRNVIMVSIDREPFTVAWVNPAFEALFGFTLDEMQTGVTPRIMQRHDLSDLKMAHHKKVACLGMNGLYDTPFKDTFVNYNKAGEPVEVDLTIFRMVLGGGHGGCVGFVTTMKHV